MRKFFPAANTPQGFYSRFNSVYNEKEDKKVIYIKGGSGTGKSTLMKNLASDAEKCGIEVELFYCSSDPDSLDGVRFLNTKTAIVDATSPHVQDPWMPGISGKIYNIADFWKEETLIPYKNEVMELSSLKKGHFDECYRLLKSAQALYDLSKGNTLKSEEISNQFKFKPKGNTGKTRKLFASGITPKGNVNFLDDILLGKVIGIEENNASSELLKHINYNANINGYDTEIFFCPLFPDSKAEHLVIKELNLSFTTLNDFHSNQNAHEIISFGKKQEKSTLAAELIDRACDELVLAKEHHKKIEKIYIASMDFEKMDKTYENLKKELLQ